MKALTEQQHTLALSLGFEVSGEGMCYKGDRICYHSCSSDKWITKDRWSSSFYAATRWHDTFEEAINRNLQEYSAGYRKGLETTAAGVKVQP